MPDSLATQIDATDSDGWPALHNADRAADLSARLPALGLEGRPAGECLSRIASGSPYLARLLALNETALTHLLSLEPEAAVEDILARTIALADAGPDEASRELRRLKAEMALLVSILDLSGLWDNGQVMGALSRFADEAVKVAFAVALSQVSGLSPDGQLGRAGIAVYAMGKHGARELNYSSDIDLVIFHDTEAVEAFLADAPLTERQRETRRFLNRCVHEAMALLSDQTEEGYVFRTDLRLRPDPGSSSVTVSVPGAEHYYETYGQNWERAAFIKARFIAGDSRVAQQIDAILRPFVWRKYLDYSAIEDIHSIKRQIHAVHGRPKFDVPGHDIKLGRGGIREIEFFVQTQQLILGGRTPSLREPTTIGGLQALAAAGHIKESTRDDLAEAYLYLRHLEHRIQMINDEQTHQVPEASSEVERLAHFAGYETGDDLATALVAVLRRVHAHYADLFHEEDDLSAGIGSLVFTGVDDDPETVRTLSDLGFASPNAASATIRRWHPGGMRATRSARGRELLTKLVPSIIRACSRVDDPDAALAAFDAFLRNMPAGVQAFSLMLNNLEVLDLVAGLVSLSPRLSREMAVHGRLVEVLLDEAFLDRSDADLVIDGAPIMEAIHETEDFEDALNALRREDREIWFQIACRLLLERSAPRDASRSFTTLAEHGVTASLAIAEREMKEAHGTCDGGLAVIGMGRLGAGNLTATSDLDLIFVYDGAAETESSGPRRLDATTWFTRYVRRAVTALSAQTEEGGLYEIDMALRPSGGAGPAAVTLSAFEKYYDNDAWVWEEMALTKARVVAGNDALADALNSRIETVLCRRREEDQVRAAVIDMRQRLLEAKPAKTPLQVKTIHGGLTDIDFICQFLSLVHAHDKGRFPAHFADALPVMASLGLVPGDDCETLIAAAAAFETVIQIARIALDREADPAGMPDAARGRIAERLGLTGGEALEPFLADHQSAVRDVFARLVGAVD